MPGELAGYALLVAAGIGLLAVLVIVRRERRSIEPERRDLPVAPATEGMKLCPTCGEGNLWTDATCIYCGSKLPG